MHPVTKIPIFPTCDAAKVDQECECESIILDIFFDGGKTNDVTCVE